jgi:hypothetical protein
MSPARQVGNAIDSMVAGSARGVTRRRFLRRAGQAAFGTAVAVAYGSLTVRPAEAAVCGPSPYCNLSTRCYSSGACHNTSRTKPRAYSKFYCISSGAGYPNCWYATSPAGNRYRCCDCCADYNTGGNRCSTNCGSGFYACICRSAGPV